MAGGTVLPGDATLAVPPAILPDAVATAGVVPQRTMLAPVVTSAPERDYPAVPVRDRTAAGLCVSVPNELASDGQGCPAPLFDFWREIPGLAGYEISRDGRVFSKISGRPLKTFTRANGYVGFNALKNGKPAWPEVHRCLALAFHGEPSAPDAHAAHRDGDRSNNTDRNIRWASPSENAGDKTRHGTAGIRLTVEQRGLLSCLAGEDVAHSRLARLVGCDQRTVRRFRSAARGPAA
jgi:hypothetical protein